MVPFDELSEDHKGSSWRRLLPLIVVGIALVTLLFYWLLRPAREDSTDDVRPVDFELPLLNNAESLSSADLRGQVVVLNFWATWCEPCRREMPMFERVWRDYRDRGVTIVGVDVRDSESDARSFIEELNISYPIVRDEDEILVARLRVDPLPQTFFIDDEGRVAGDQVLGELTEAELAARLDELLEQEEGTEPD
jgi:cytochrome c biogenesis protein CcmG, thiol:disulfide interchange protein DsbE